MAPRSVSEWLGGGSRAAKKAAPLRVAMDVTPLAGPRTGVGRYVQYLLQALAARGDVELGAAAFTLRGRNRLRDLPPKVRLHHRPVPARLLHRSWLRSDFPAAEWTMGHASVYHGTNFVLPPAKRAPGVVTIHDLSFVRFPELVSRASLDYQVLVPRALQRAAMVITPTRAIADEIIERYAIAPDRIAATPLGVDPSWFDVTATANPVLNGRTLPREFLLAVGTLEPRKGLDVLLVAYRELLAQQPATPPLVLVGGAGWGPRLETSGIPSEKLILPGYIGLTELQQVVADALVLVFPSRYEGFGLPPLEALAAGTPVIATDVPAVVEVLADAGPMVEFVGVDDAAALTEAMRATLDRTPALADEKSARAHAAEYSWEACAEATMKVYRAAVG